MPKLVDQNVTRQILAEIERNPAVSQKSLSETLGISVGMINWHVKRCVTKGLVKLQQAPVRRYMYYLTPEGFAEKSSLTASFLKASFDIFQTGRQQYAALFALCSANQWQNIVFLGNTELTELATLISNRHEDLNVVAVIDRAGDAANREETVLFPSIEDFAKNRGNANVGAVIACDYQVAVEKSSVTDEIAKHLHLDQARFLIPGFLQ